MNGSTKVERLANRLSPPNEEASACCTAAFSAVEMTFVVGAVPLSTEHASRPTAASEVTARFIQRTPFVGTDRTRVYSPPVAPEAATRPATEGYGGRAALW